MANHSTGVQVKAEPHTGSHGDPPDARLSALIVEAHLYQQVQQQMLQLEDFKKRVHQRIRRQRRKYDSSKQETVIVEKHIPDSDKTDPLWVEPVQDCYAHNVAVIDCRKDRLQCVEQLLTFCEKPVKQHSQTSSQLCHEKPSQQPKANVLSKQNHTNVKTHEDRVTDKTELASHCLTIRRMYSSLERQQSRVNALNRQQQKGAEKRRLEREEERRNIESQFSSSKQLSLDEREKATQWLEMVALERREQKLTRQKEMERFCEALKFQLHEKYPDLPSLCPCHPSIWETDPFQCARNCPFYRNHSKFANELSSLLRSISKK